MSPKHYFKNIKKNKMGIKREGESPSNSRTIPASPKLQRGETENLKFSLPKINPKRLFKLYRIVLKVFVIITFIMAVVVVGLDLKNNLQTKQEIDSQREVLTRNLKFWEDFISKHQNYPDAYFQTSILEYRLGDSVKAKMYVEKGLVSDPNSENGRKIEQFLSK